MSTQTTTFGPKAQNINNLKTFFLKRRKVSTSIFVEEDTQEFAFTQRSFDESEIHREPVLKSPSKLNIQVQDKEVNVEKLLQLELDILKLARVHHISRIIDVHFSFHDTDQFIHTVCVDSGKVTKDIVLVHGWAGSWILFYRLLHLLSQHYRVWCIDLLGMGASSRPLFNIESTPETVRFFVESLEEWRKSVKLDKFTFASHSLGGYISSQYALHYPQYIDRLVLISPAGVTKPISDNFLEEEMKNKGFFERQFMKFEDWMCQMKFTPSGLIQKFGFAGKYVLKSQLGRFKLGSEAELALLAEYMVELMNLPTSSEKSLFYLVQYPATYSTMPLEVEFAKEKERLPFPIEFIFGDRDWMSPQGARRIAQTQNLKFYTISNSGHHIYFDNTEELYDAIMGKLQAEEIADLFDEAIQEKREESCIVIYTS